MLDVSDSFRSERPNRGSNVEIGRRQYVQRIRRPKSPFQTGRALVDFAIPVQLMRGNGEKVLQYGGTAHLICYNVPVGLFYRPYLDESSFGHETHDEFRIRGPGDADDRVQARKQLRYL